MEVFVLIIIGYFLLPVLLGMTKSKTSKRKLGRQSRASQSSDQKNQNNRPQAFGELSDLRSRLQAAQNLRNAAPQDVPQKDEVRPRSKDYRDNNSSRRTDWGKRAGPELISTQNILIAIMLSTIVYLVLQVAETL